MGIFGTRRILWVGGRRCGAGGGRRRNALFPMKIICNAIITIFWAIKVYGLEPLTGFLCSAEHRISVERIDHDYKCDLFLEVEKNATKPYFVYRWAIGQMSTTLPAWTCSKEISVRRVKRHLWGISDDDEDLKNDWVEMMTDSECIAAKNGHSSYGMMVKGENVLRTNNVIKVPDPSYWWSTGKWMEEKTVNVVLDLKSKVISSSGGLFSPSGSMIHCNLKKSPCVLANNLTIYWEPTVEMENNFYKFREGYYQCDEKVCLSKDHSDAFLRGDSSYKGYAYLRDCSRCAGIKGSLHTFAVFGNDDSLYTLFKDESDHKGRSKRAVDSLNDIVNSLSSGGKGPKFVTSEILKGALESIVSELEYQMKTNFYKAAYDVCKQKEINSKLITSLATSWKSTTKLIRSIYNLTNVYGEVSNALLSVYPCKEVLVQTVSMNYTCTEEIPVTFIQQGKMYRGYLEPHTRIIVSVPTKMECRFAKEMLFEHGTNVFYNALTGQFEDYLRPAKIKIFGEFSPTDFNFSGVVIPSFSYISLNKFFDFNQAAEMQEQTEKYTAALNTLLGTTSKRNLGENNPITPYSLATGILQGGILQLLFGQFSLTQILLWFCILTWIPIFLGTYILPNAIRAYFMFSTGGSYLNLGDLVMKSINTTVENNERQKLLKQQLLQNKNLNFEMDRYPVIN